jgi:hypothetical protein
MRPLIWVSKSMEKLAAALTEMGHPIGADTVRKELVRLRFSRTIFGNLGSMKLILESAHEIVENDPMFRVPRSR